MGYIKHDTIVVSSWDEKWIKKARAKAVAVGLKGLVSRVVRGWMNGEQSFFVGPDGSKEGWDDSNRGNDGREAFIEWLKAQDRGDWIAVSFGGDEPHKARLLDWNSR